MYSALQPLALTGSPFGFPTQPMFTGGWGVPSAGFAPWFPVFSLDSFGFADPAPAPDAPPAPVPASTLAPAPDSAPAVSSGVMPLILGAAMPTDTAVPPPLVQPSPPPVLTARTPAARPAPPTAPSRATTHGREIWAGVVNPRKVHVTQVQSKFNPAAPAGNRDCGPASVLMALRMLGLAKASGANVQRQIDAIRTSAMGGPGSALRTLTTTNHDLARALSSRGATTTEVRSLTEIKRALREGTPVILNGNPANEGAYAARFGPKKMLPYDGGHWIVVTGIDRRTGKFIINDPLSSVGAVKVRSAELEAYRGGSLGIVVSR